MQKRAEKVQRPRVAEWVYTRGESSRSSPAVCDPPTLSSHAVTHSLPGVSSVAATTPNPVTTPNLPTCPKLVPTPNLQAPSHLQPLPASLHLPNLQPHQISQPCPTSQPHPQLLQATLVRQVFVMQERKQRTGCQQP